MILFGLFHGIFHQPTKQFFRSYNLFITVSWVMTVGEPWFGTEVDYFSLR